VGPLTGVDQVQQGDGETVMRECGTAGHGSPRSLTFSTLWLGSSQQPSQIWRPVTCCFLSCGLVGLRGLRGLQGFFSRYPRRAFRA
jgi:hypothetical protein